MKKINVKFIAESAIIAALYAALTWLFSPISYGSIQFRISEVMILLVLFKPSYAFALILGCFISNTTSSLGIWDMLFGTLATALAVIPMMKIKNIYVAALLPVITNSIIVALELYFALDISPIWLSMLTVGIGEAVVLYLIGIPVMISISKNEGLIEFLNFENNIKASSFMNLTNSLALALSVIGIILYFALPFSDGVTLFDLSKDNIWLVIALIFPIIYALLFVILKDKVKVIINLPLIMVSYITIGILIISNVRLQYFIIYGIYVLFLALLSLRDYKMIKKKE